MPITIKNSHTKVDDPWFKSGHYVRPTNFGIFARGLNSDHDIRPNNFDIFVT